jgi:SAM-dependent methyltransferase
MIPPKTATWQQSHTRYWTAVAPRYDQLYRTRWSRYENLRVMAGLSRHAVKARPLVLDLGCGTGLGHRILSETIGGHSYVGLDISAAMLRRLEPRLAPSGVLRADVGAPLPFREQSFDLVVALFATGSYVPELGGLLREVHRVLKPSGLATISVVSRDSLRRRLAGQRGGVEILGTRGDPVTSGPPPVRTYTPQEARAAAARAGLRVRECIGLNALSGVAEIPFLFRLGRVMAQRRPWLSHTFDLVVDRGPSETDDLDAARLPHRRILLPTREAVR